MITYFIYKQLDHAMSVIKLDPSMDAGLVVRTMIEGVINLTWVLEKPDERVKDWFDYSTVYDFKLLERKESGGSLVSEDDKKEVIENYQQSAAAFLKRNGKPHDSFRKGENLGNISKNNNDLEYFYQNYKWFSDWVHWGSQSLRHAIEEKQDEISYYEDDHVYRIPALVIAFASLLDIAVKTNEHFELEQTGSLEEISNKMLEDLKKTGMQLNE